MLMCSALSELSRLETTVPNPQLYEYLGRDYTAELDLESVSGSMFAWLFLHAKNFSAETASNPASKTAV